MLEAALREMRSEKYSNFMRQYANGVKGANGILDDKYMRALLERSRSAMSAVVRKAASGGAAVTSF